MLSIGTIGNKAHDAVVMAKKEGVNVMHYDMRFLKPIDNFALEDITSKCSTVITIEDGTLLGGLFSVVSEFVAKNNLNNKVVGLGIPDSFVEQGTIEELISECKYNTQDIFEKIMENKI